MKLWIIMDTIDDTTLQQGVVNIYCDLYQHEDDDVAQILEVGNPNHVAELDYIQLRYEEEEVFEIDFYRDVPSCYPAREE